MNKVSEIIHRIIVNDPIVLLIIIFLIGLAISINIDFNKIKSLSKRALKEAKKEIK